MPPFDPAATKKAILNSMRNRIDMLKRINVLPKAKDTKLDEKVYHKTPSGAVVRIIEKQPSKYALRKHTKRARKYAAQAQKEV